MQNKKIYNEPEVKEKVDLCLADGTLNREAVGWSRHPLHNCNLSGSPLRKKQWNYWCINTENFLFSATLSNIDYLGLAFIYFLDFATKQFHELTVTRIFGKGCDLGNLVSDPLVFTDPKLSMSIEQTERDTRIIVDCPDFAGERLKTDIKVHHPAQHETLNVVIPWSDKLFQFTSKQHTLPVEGMIELGDKQYDAQGGYACLDFGRGKWPFSSFWNWAGGSGKAEGHLVGLNFGAGWTDGTGMNENGVTVDGVLTKISEDLLFDYDREDYMKPWKIKTVISNQVDLIFEPFFERVAKTEVLILGSEVHQMIGHFSGSVKDAGGKSYQLKGLIGWAEDHHARW